MSMTGEHETTEAAAGSTPAGAASSGATAADAAGGLDVSEPTASEGGAASTATDHDEITRTLDRLSLTQALVDFELANARVLDLTARLVEVNERVVRGQAEADALRGEVEALRTAVQAAEGELRAIRASRGHRLVQRLAAVRAALRKG